MEVRKLSRRDVLKAGGAAGGALVLGIGTTGCTADTDSESDITGPFVPNVFVTLDTDGTVQITVSRSEMGQGVRTSLPRIVAGNAPRSNSLRSVSYRSGRASSAQRSHSLVSSPLSAWSGTSAFGPPAARSARESGSVTSRSPFSLRYAKRK